MKYILTIVISLSFYSISHGQEFDLPKLSPYELSPQIQSPLYQNFNQNDFDLLVKNVNVFDSRKGQVNFNFLEASSSKERRPSYEQFYSAVNRQMAQYSDFKIEINNSLNNPFFDYHDEPIYSGSFRLKNSAYIEANRMSPNFRGGAPLLYSPSLSDRRGLIWY